jgi:hypothetical protein
MNEWVMLNNECVRCGASLPDSMECEYCRMPSSWDVLSTKPDGTISIMHWHWSGYMTTDKFGGILASRPYNLTSYIRC